MALIYGVQKFDINYGMVYEMGFGTPQGLDSKNISWVPEDLSLPKMLLKMKGKDGGGGESGAAAAQNLLSDKPEGGILQGEFQGSSVVFDLDYKDCNKQATTFQNISSFG